MTRLQNFLQQQHQTTDESMNFDYDYSSSSEIDEGPIRLNLPIPQYNSENQLSTEGDETLIDVLSIHQQNNDSNIGSSTEYSTESSNKLEVSTTINSFAHDNLATSGQFILSNNLSEQQITTTTNITPSKLAQQQNDSEIFEDDFNQNNESASTTSIDQLSIAPIDFNENSTTETNVYNNRSEINLQDDYLYALFANDSLILDESSLESNESDNALSTTQNDSDDDETTTENINLNEDENSSNETETTIKDSTEHTTATTSSDDGDEEGSSGIGEIFLMPTIVVENIKDDETELDKIETSNKFIYHHILPPATKDPVEDVTDSLTASSLVTSSARNKVRFPDDDETTRKTVKFPGQATNRFATKAPFQWNGEHLKFWNQQPLIPDPDVYQTHRENSRQPSESLYKELPTRKIYRILEQQRNWRHQKYSK